MIWNNRIQEILADPKQARQAAALYWLINQHLTRLCFHKRMCPEKSLWGEASDFVERADREEVSHAGQK